MKKQTKLNIIFLTSLILISIVILVLQKNKINKENNMPIDEQDKVIENEVTNDEIKENTQENEETELNKIEIDTSKNESNNTQKIENNSKEKQTETNKVISLNNTANDVAKTYSNATRIVYGESVQQRPLEAYLIKGNGENSKTIFIEFEVHGYEDEYNKDGQILVNLGNNIVEHYAKNPNDLGDYQILIIPSANPDGVIEGKNNNRETSKNAFGRCTADGIDINRDFKSSGFKAIESQKLKELMDKYKMNIHIDFHGWENSVIGDPIIVKTFLNELGLTYDKSNRYGSGSGYVIEYTHNTYGAKSAIVEFKNSKSVNKQKVINALNIVMQEI